ncbi:MAG: RloB domain-containing protein [Porphyrobacter sp.]|nr:RloB domain-containing protein [Porphyrobacter sp.]
MNTETGYFQAFKGRYPRALFQLEISGGEGGPATLLKKALQKKKEIARLARKESFFANDKVWIVFDEDTHPYVQQTINEARRQEVGVAYSNPCFELWIILHLQMYDRPESPVNMQRKCGELIPGYDRHSSKVCDFDSLLEHLPQAEKNAARLVESRAEQGSPFGVPVCTVHDLTQILRDS